MNEFRTCLRIAPTSRTLHDLEAIYFGLKAYEVHPKEISSLAKSVRLQVLRRNEILFTTGEFASCWYILISGAVFINGSMFLPGSR